MEPRMSAMSAARLPTPKNTSYCHLIGKCKEKNGHRWAKNKTLPTISFSF